MKNLIAHYRQAGYPDRIAEKLAKKHYVEPPMQDVPVDEGILGDVDVTEKKVVQMGSVKMHPVKKKKAPVKKKKTT